MWGLREWLLGFLPYTHGRQATQPTSRALCTKPPRRAPIEQSETTAARLPYDRFMRLHQSAYHRITVADSVAWRTMSFERNQQSSMALDDPFDSDIEYVDYLHLAMAVAPDAARSLVIGLGGGSVVKRMWRDYAPMHVDAVEIDSDVVDIARAHFALPDDERIAVTIGDGREFVQAIATTYDIIIVDAFDDDHIPCHLMTREFMRELRGRLAPDGVVVYNALGSLHGPDSAPFRSLHRTACEAWRRVWLFPLGYAHEPSAAARNIIMLATDAPLATEELLARISTCVHGRVSVRAFRTFGEDLYRGTIEHGDVPTLTDVGGCPGADDARNGDRRAHPSDRPSARETGRAGAV